MSFARVIVWPLLVCVAVTTAAASTLPRVPATARDAAIAARALRLLEAATDETEIAVTAVRWSPSGPHVRVQQLHAGVPIWRAEAVVSFDPDLRPMQVANDIVVATLPASVPPTTLPKERAISLGLAAVGVRSQPYATPEAVLFWRTDAGATGWVLAWRTRVACADPAGDWEVWIDAGSGDVLDLNDRTLYYEPAAAVTARVFLPDPVTATGNRALRDADDADTAVPSAAYSIVLLAGLDSPVNGVQHLTGEYVVVEDWDAPHVPPTTSQTGTFLFARSSPGFEDAMVYFHIDAMQRWFQQLGFYDANNRRQPADAHGLNGLDNSKYLPSLRKLAFGDGGVDDAEDAGVIVHEYGHATQHDIVPTWGEGGHTLAMGEGFGDYLAHSYALSLQPERTRAWNGVFLWDGHNEFWPGRPALDRSLSYPRDADGSPHQSGTLWCSILTDVLYTLGDRTIADRLVLDHLYALTGSATMLDAANAILASDAALYRGAHLATLERVFRAWGLPVTSIDPPVEPPADGWGLAASPNPFNPNTTLRYEVAHDSFVEFDVYDPRGRLVRRLLHAYRPAGVYALHWDGNNENGAPVPSGTYLLRLHSPAHTVSHKITLVR